MNKKLSKRILAMILSFAVVFSMIPGVVFAAGGSQDNVNVYVTICKQGSIELGKDGKTGMIQVPLSVPSSYNEIDVLKKVHELYSENGEQDYKESSGWFSKFWGEETYNIGYFKNGKMVMSPGKVSEGDYIEGVIYGDYTKERYTTFQTREISSPAGAAIMLRLLGNVILSSDYSGGMMNGGVADEPMSNTKVLVGNEESCNIPYDDSGNYITDENGEVYLSFSQPGVYYVAADTSTTNNIPATCKINVTEEESDEAKETIVNGDINSLKFDDIKGENEQSDAITKALNLIKSGNSGKTTVEWISDNPEIISNTGIVNRPLNETGDKKVVLTAKIKYGNIIKEKKIEVTVLKLPASKEVLENVIKQLPEKLRPAEWNDAGLLKQDTNVISLVQNKVNEINNSVTVKSTCIPGEQTQISENGDITYGDKTVRNKTVKFTLCLGNEEAPYEPKVTIDAKKATKEEALKGEWLKFDSIKATNDEINNVKFDLELPAEDDERYYTEIEWESSNSDVISIDNSTVNGIYKAKVTRPELGKGNANVTLTAKIKPGTYWGYGMAPMGPMPEPAYGTVTFDIIVPAVTQDELTEAQKMVDAASDLFSLDDATIMGTDEKANLQDLRYHINNIPYNMNYVNNKEGYDVKYKVINVKWKSENPGITAVTNNAKVSRASEDQTGDIVLTLSYNGAVAEKRFPTTVKAWTDDDKKIENDMLQKVGDALTFGTIKKDNIISADITSDMVGYRSAVVEGENIGFKTSNEYNKFGANISWKSSNEDVIKVSGSNLKVTIPENDVNVDLTATLKSVRFSEMEGVNNLEKTIKVTVLGSGKKPVIDRIADKLVKDFKNDPWVVADIISYSGTNGNDSGLSDEQIQSFINSIAEKAYTTEKAGDLAKYIIALKALGFDASRVITVNQLEGTYFDIVAKLKTMLKDNTGGVNNIYTLPYVLIALQQDTNYATSDEINSIINSLLEKQLETGGWGYSKNADIDTEAPIILALSKYYNTNNEVRAAIDKAIDANAIKQHQGESGAIYSSWTKKPSAESTGLILTAIAAAGKDISLYKKGENSLVDGLNGLLNEDKDGFLYNGTTNAMATEQGFRGLIAIANNKEGKAYNIYDFSGKASNIARATSSGSTTIPTEPKGDNITVSVTVKSDTEYWLNNYSVTIPGTGATVYHAFTKACDNNGITYVGAEKGYVSSITKSGKTLSEFDKGQNSGWMYKVNGILPEVGLTTYSIKDGDNIVWFYTNDWTTVPGVNMGDQNKSQVTTSGTDSKTTTSPTEVKVSGSIATATVTDENAAELVKQAKENKSAEIVLNVSSADTDKAETVNLELNKKTLESIVNDTDAAVTVKTQTGEINLDKETLKQINSEAAGDVITIEITRISKPEETHKTLIGADGQIYRLTVKSGDSVISQFKGNVTVRLAIPAALKDRAIAAVHIKDGSLEKLDGRRITQDKVEFYEFKTPHFSEFALVDTDQVKLDADDTDNADRAKTLVKELKLTAASSKTSKKNVKITVKMNSKNNALIKELKGMGYTVKYRYYRSTKKASKYTAVKTKTAKTYINTKGKKGSRYYYKARVMVYDGDKLVAQSALKQCKYAARVWSK